MCNDCQKTREQIKKDIIDNVLFNISQLKDVNNESEIKVDADKAIINTEPDQNDEELPPHSVIQLGFVFFLFNLTNFIY